MKIASFNVNSIRARLALLVDWLSTEAPDVVCLQETKSADEDFPAGALLEAGYQSVFSGEKTYNGVAILSTRPLEEVRKGFNPDGFGYSRHISARVGGVTVVNTYAPQGQAPDSVRFREKLEFFAILHDWFDKNFKPSDMVVWAGDFNIAPEARDVYDPEGLAGHVGFHADEHAVLERIRSWGFVDVFRLHDDRPGEYTFWDYRVRGGVKNGIGWRIDHIWATSPAAAFCRRSWIDKSPRLKEKPSDHTPILAEFDL